GVRRRARRAIDARGASADPRPAREGMGGARRIGRRLERGDRCRDLPLSAVPRWLRRHVALGLALRPWASERMRRGNRSGARRLAVIGAGALSGATMLAALGERGATAGGADAGGPRDAGADRQVTTAPQKIPP